LPTRKLPANVNYEQTQLRDHPYAVPLPQTSGEKHESCNRVDHRRSRIDDIAYKQRSGACRFDWRVQGRHIHIGSVEEWCLFWTRRYKGMVRRSRGRGGANDICGNRAVDSDGKDANDAFGDPAFGSRSNKDIGDADANIACGWRWARDSLGQYPFKGLSLLWRQMVREDQAWGIHDRSGGQSGGQSR